LLVLAVILTASIVSSAIILPNILIHKPDFVIQSNPPSKIILAGPGNGGSVNITFNSINNFAGVLSSTVKSPTGLTASLSGPNPDNFPLAHEQIFLLNLNALTPGNYTVAVTGSSGTISHSINVVVVAQGLSLNFGPGNLTLPPGTKGDETIGMASLNGLFGDLALTATVPATFNPNTVTATFVPSTLRLDSGRIVESTVLVNVGVDQSCGYQCVYAQDTDVQISVGVIGQTGSFSGSFRVLINESLTMTSVTFPSNMQANITAQNVGPSIITLFNYTVTNQAGSQYVFPYELQTLGSGIAPGSAGTARILIGSSCSQCSIRGTAYTFVIGQTYVITIESARGNPFSFAVTG
jgi:hypothetical protein